MSGNKIMLCPRSPDYRGYNSANLNPRKTLRPNSPPKGLMPGIVDNLINQAVGAASVKQKLITNMYKVYHNYSNC